MNHEKRKLMKSLLSWLSIPGLATFITGCDHCQQSSATQDNPDAFLKCKFKGIYGGEKRIDALLGLSDVVLLMENNWIFAAGVFGTSPSISSYGGGADRLPMPKFLRYLRYSSDAKFITHHSWPMYEGEPLVDVTVPVASRIPDDLLADLRRDRKGLLRLKIRLMSDAILIGWDIERRPGFNPKKRDNYGHPVYVAPVHSFAGGDFREAKIYNGKTVRKGWYIDPKTGERIETDF